jgi:DNA-binding response OmpR family regulator
VTRQNLLKDIWGTDQVADSGYLRLYMSQLRKKLERPLQHLLRHATASARRSSGRDWRSPPRTLPGR